MNNHWSRGLLGLILSCLGLTVFACWPELHLVSIDVRMGHVSWSRSLPMGKQEIGQPIIHENNLILHSTYTDPWNKQGWHRVVAYSTQAGQQLWQRDIYSDYAETAGIRQFAWPVATPETLLVNMPIRSGDPSNQLVVFDLETGEHDQHFHFFHPLKAWTTSVMNHNQTVWSITREAFGTGKDCARFPLILTKQELWLQETQWKITLPEQTCRLAVGLGSLLAANGQFVFVKGAETIQARDAETGAPRFRIDAVAERIDLVGDTLLVVDARSMMAYDAQTGELSWTSTDICGAESRLHDFTTDAETIYIKCDRDIDFDSIYGITAVQLSNGQPRWFTPIKSSISHSPSITANHVVVIAANQQPSQHSRAVTVLSKNDGTVQFQFPVDLSHSQTMVPTNQTHAYFVNRAPRWHHWLFYRHLKFRLSSPRDQRSVDLPDTRHIAS